MAPSRRSQKKKSTDKTGNAPAAVTPHDAVIIENRTIGKKIKAAEQKIRNLMTDGASEIRKLTDEHLTQMNVLKAKEYSIDNRIREEELVAAKIEKAKDKVEKTLDGLKKDEWKRAEETKFLKEFENGTKAAEREAEAREKVDVYQRQILEVREAERQLRDSGVENERIWRLCETCGQEFTDVEERSPRLLACGHTLCFQCIKTMAKSDGVQCPIDGAVTFIQKKNLNTLTKNYIAFHM